MVLIKNVTHQRETLSERPIRQPLKMGTFFGQNHPYRWVWVLRLEQHTHVQLKSEYPPPPGVINLLKLKFIHFPACGFHGKGLRRTK